MNGVMCNGSKWNGARLIGAICTVVAITALALAARGEQATESDALLPAEAAADVSRAASVSEVSDDGAVAVAPEPSVSDGSQDVCEASAELEAAVEVCASPLVSGDDPPGSTLRCCWNVYSECYETYDPRCQQGYFEGTCPCPSG